MRLSPQVLDIEETLRAAMMSMSSAQFETVLHPVFQVTCFFYTYHLTENFKLFFEVRH